MYHPYLRGKQNELILLRENTELLNDASMIPIIEPVKKNLAPLKKAITTLMNANSKFIIIINPKHGDFKNDATDIAQKIINETLSSYDNFCMGYTVDAESDINEIESFLNTYQNKSITFIHNGFPKADQLAQLLNNYTNIAKHIFMDGQSGKLYQKKFKKDGIKRVLIRDGFKKYINREYPNKEHFSDLHITFDDESMDGFGDFLIVGNDYSESGGPAYAIALHLTYLEEDEDMYIRHFISDRVDTPTDPAGKFLEALDKLVNTVEADPLILKTDAYKQYKDFFDKSHFPGLGYVKKLSMQHHMEIIAKFLTEQ